jgi:ribonuclease P protein subunit POP4
VSNITALSSTGHIAYFRIDKKKRAQFTSDTPFTPSYVQANVTRSSNPYQLYTSRIQGRHILLENPVRDSRATKEREARRARRAAQKKRDAADVLSQKQAREKGLWKLDKSEVR